MSEAPKLAEVPQLKGGEANVIETLEGLLERARSGEITSVAVAYECRGGYSGHAVAFGAWGNRPLPVGKLQVVATHIVMNECLEWKPDA